MRLLAPWFLVLAIACTEHGKGGGSLDGGFPNDGGSGLSCGGFGGALCPAGEFCDFPRNSCGATDEAGICRTRPTGCPDNFEPVCGCDRIVHSTPCDAAAVGFDVDAFGNCPVPQGQFACGFRQCSIAGDFCTHAGSDIGNEPDGFSCQPLPVCPTEPNCACLQTKGIPCADQCAGDATSGLTVTCLGG